MSEECSHSTSINNDEIASKDIKGRKWEIPTHVQSLRCRCADLESRNSHLLNCVMQFRKHAKQIADTIDNEHRLDMEKFIERLNTMLDVFNSVSASANCTEENKLFIKSELSEELKCEPNGSNMRYMSSSKIHSPNESDNSKEVKTKLIAKSSIDINKISNNDNKNSNAGREANIVSSTSSNTIRKTECPVNGVIVSGRVVKEFVKPRVANMEENEQEEKKEESSTKREGNNNNVRRSILQKGTAGVVVVSGTVITASPISATTTSFDTGEVKEEEAKENKQALPRYNSERCKLNNEYEEVLLSIVRDMKLEHESSLNALNLRLSVLLSADIALTNATEEMEKIKADNDRYKAEVNKLYNQLHVLQRDVSHAVASSSSSSSSLESTEIETKEEKESAGLQIEHKIEDKMLAKQTISTNHEEHLLLGSDKSVNKELINNNHNKDDDNNNNSNNYSDNKELLQLYYKTSAELAKLSDKAEKLNKENEELLMALSELSAEREVLQKSNRFLQEKSTHMEGQLQRLLSSQLPENTIKANVAITSTSDSNDNNKKVTNNINKTISSTITTTNTANNSNNSNSNRSSDNKVVKKSDIDSNDKKVALSSTSTRNTINEGKESTRSSSSSLSESPITTSNNNTTFSSTSMSSSLSERNGAVAAGNANTSTVPSTTSTSNSPTVTRGATATHTASLLQGNEKEVLQNKAVMERLNNEVKQRAQRCAKLSEANTKLVNENNNLKASLLQYQRQLNEKELALEREMEVMENERRVTDLEREVAKLRLALHDRVSAIKNEKDKIEGELRWNAKREKVYNSATNSLLRQLFTLQLRSTIKKEQTSSCKISNSTNSNNRNKSNDETSEHLEQGIISTMTNNINSSNGGNYSNEEIDNEIKFTTQYQNDEHTNTRHSSNQSNYAMATNQINNNIINNTEKKDSYGYCKDDVSEHDAEKIEQRLQNYYKEEFIKLKNEHKIELNRLETLNRELRLALSCAQEELLVQNKQAEMSRSRSNRSVGSNYKQKSIANNNDKDNNYYKNNLIHNQKLSPASELNSHKRYTNFKSELENTKINNTCQGNSLIRPAKTNCYVLKENRRILLSEQLQEPEQKQQHQQVSQQQQQEQEQEQEQQEEHYCNDMSNKEEYNQTLERQELASLIRRTHINANPPMSSSLTSCSSFGTSRVASAQDSFVITKTKEKMNNEGQVERVDEQAKMESVDNNNNNICKSKSNISHTNDEIENNNTIERVMCTDKTEDLCKSYKNKELSSRILTHFTELEKPSEALHELEECEQTVTPEQLSLTIKKPMLSPEIPSCLTFVKNKKINSMANIVPTSLSMQGDNSNNDFNAKTNLVLPKKVKETEFADKETKYISKKKEKCACDRYDPEHTSLEETVQVENEILLRRLAETQEENWTLTTHVEDLEHECQTLQEEIKRNARTLNLLLQSGVVSPAAVQKGSKEGELRSLQHLLHEALEEKMKLQQEVRRLRNI